jgi:Aspartyl/Asparaginyl beta-hydroxylase
MAHFQHIAAGVPIQRLLIALQHQPELFGQHPHRTSAPGSPHRDASDIWVRYNNLANFGPRFNDAHDAVWYPAWRALPDLSPIIYWLMEAVEGERLGGILITKLPPGGRIRTHIDQGWHASYYQKFYIALQNEPGAVFSFPKRDLIAQAGDCFWFDNSVPHGVHNGSHQDRLALIVCIKTEKFKGVRHDGY